MGKIYIFLLANTEQIPGPRRFIKIRKKIINSGVFYEDVLTIMLSE